MKSIVISGQIGTGKTRTSMTIADEKGIGYAEIREIKELDKYVSKPTVIDFEGAGMSPKVFNSLPNKDKFEAVFVAYDNVTAEEVAKHIKGHGDGRGYSPEILLEVAKSIVAISKIIKAECEKFGYKFIGITAKDITDITIKWPRNRVADLVWEHLFKEKKQLDLSKVGNKFEK